MEKRLPISFEKEKIIIIFAIAECRNFDY